MAWECRGPSLSARVGATPRGRQRGGRPSGPSLLPIQNHEGRNVPDSRPPSRQVCHENAHQTRPERHGQMGESHSSRGDPRIHRARRTGRTDRQTAGLGNAGIEGGEMSMCRGVMSRDLAPLRFRVWEGDQGNRGTRCPSHIQEGPRTVAARGAPPTFWDTAMPDHAGRSVPSFPMPVQYQPSLAGSDSLEYIVKSANRLRRLHSSLCGRCRQMEEHRCKHC